MMTTTERILIVLLKDLGHNTVTTLSVSLKISRQGIWTALKKLEKEELVVLDRVGTGKTSTQKIKLNWENELLDKTLVLSLMQEASGQKRWQFDLSDLKPSIDFLIIYGSILHSPKDANDIDIIGIVSKEVRLANIDSTTLRIQETLTKKIHAINMTMGEFRMELKKQNKAYLDALKKGVILFGQEEFVNFMRCMQK